MLHRFMLVGLSTSVFGLAFCFCQTNSANAQMHQDSMGRWVNDAGGNLYGDSLLNPNADPRINPYADPRINPNADPMINPNASVGISSYYQKPEDAFPRTSIDGAPDGAFPRIGIDGEP
jgi:hypothetical protein